MLKIVTEIPDLTTKILHIQTVTLQTCQSSQQGTRQETRHYFRKHGTQEK